ncbi:protein phosphatase 1H [Oratosquilla oratoria]|uniref:protein phosphatase 1H n=1 Tax=Oratosquilla oratoria TaxID=337810 RepID=UPI003F758443
MLSRFKNALYNVVGNLDGAENGLGLGPTITTGLPHLQGPAGVPRTSSSNAERKAVRFPYTRPHFLQLNTEDEIQVTADHNIRPIICPRDISRLPWNTGYAETINAGKSKRNEDQACVHVGLLTRISSCGTQAKGPGRAVEVRTGTSQGSGGKKGSTSNGLEEKNSVDEQTVVLSAQGAKVTPRASGSEGNATASTQTPNSTGDASNSSSSFQGSSTRQQLTIPLTADGVAATGGEFLTPPSTPDKKDPPETLSIPYYYFAVFDGHAGWGAAVSAANQLHHILHEKLVAVVDLLIPDDENEDEQDVKPTGPIWIPEKDIPKENIITGALEQAFWTMDHLIAEDRRKYQVTGGCTACIGLMILGKLFVANAGDSRAVISYKGQSHPMSFDFTPETESHRIRKLGAMHPELLGGEYTHLHFVRRPVRRDLGKRVMYRDHYMTGWAYKTLTHDDLKYPLVCGEGKRSRVLGTIGVTRGFGDHDLKAQCSSILIKPFLSPEPEIRIFDVAENELTDDDVLILATDGLWDITSNEKAVATVGKSLSHFPVCDEHRYKYRYTSAAQDLVMTARGKLRERNWRTSEDKHATIDDISVFVVPLKPYKEAYALWTAENAKRAEEGRKKQTEGNVERGESQSYLKEVEEAVDIKKLCDETQGSCSFREESLDELGANLSVSISPDTTEEKILGDISLDSGDAQGALLTEIDPNMLNTLENHFSEEADLLNSVQGAR